MTFMFAPIVVVVQHPIGLDQFTFTTTSAPVCDDPSALVSSQMLLVMQQTYLGLKTVVQHSWDIEIYSGTAMGTPTEAQGFHLIRLSPQGLMPLNNL